MLSISTNAQQYTNSKHFTYYGAPVVSSISPTSGPTDGMTFIDVRGAHLSDGSAYRCQFGDTTLPLRVEATYDPGPPARVLCYSLAVALPSSQPFEISLNAQQYTRDRHHFDFFGFPVIDALSPSSGPVKGATTIRLSGVGFDFGSHYVCRFAPTTGAASVAEVLYVPATYVSFTLTTCVAPEIAGADGSADYSLRLSLNAQQYSVYGEVIYSYHGDSEVVSASPSSGPVGGGSLVTLSGVHLSNGSDYRCRFGGADGDIVVNATFDNTTLAIQCFSPLVSMRALVPLEISQNGQQFTDSGGFYSFFGPSSIASLLPIAGPSDGNTFVQVRGLSLSGGSDYRCDFGGVRGIAASAVDDSTVVCHSPALPLGVASVTISLNGQQYLPIGSNFTSYPPNRVLELSPSTGTSEGSTVVTVSGLHFRSFAIHPIACRFGEQRAHTTLIDETTLECIAPHAVSAGVAVSADAHFTDAAAPGGMLLGHARVSEGVLELTPPHHFQTGSFIFDLPHRSRPFRWFTLRSYVSIGGGRRSKLTPIGGMGFSLVFGVLPTDAPFGEGGAGHQLRLSFLTSNATLTAHFANQYLARADLSAALGTALGDPLTPPPDGPDAVRAPLPLPPFASLELRYTYGELRVLVSDQLLLTLPHLPLEAPGTVEWQFGFGARTGLNHDAHRIANITFRSGAQIFADDVSVEVTQNDETYTSDDVRFTYQPHPRVSYTSIDRGPLDGATRVRLSGSNFSRASHPLCKFGESIVNGTVREGGLAWGGGGGGRLAPHMECISPAHALGAVHLELTLNGQDYTTDGGPFTFYATSLSSVSPEGGDQSGGALLTIRGHGLGSGNGYRRYLCRFTQGAHHARVSATYLPDHDAVRCTSPALPEAAPADLTVSVNGQQFTAPAQLSFSVYNLSVGRIEPPYSIHDGGQTINLTTSGAILFTHMACSARRPPPCLKLVGP